MKKLLSLFAKLCVFLLVSGSSFLTFVIIIGSLEPLDPESLLATIQMLSAFIVPIFLGALVTRKVFKPEQRSEGTIPEGDAVISDLMAREGSAFAIFKEELSRWNWQLVVGSLILGVGFMRIIPNFLFGIVLIVLGLGVLSIGGTKYKEKQEMQERELRRKLYAATAKESSEKSHVINKWEAPVVEERIEPTERKAKKAIYKRWWVWAVMFLALLGSCGGNPESSTETVLIPEKTVNTTIVTEAEETDDNIQEIESHAVVDTATVGEKNALRKAYSYLDFTAFSYTGLIDQLKFEGFTDGEAAYAVENCGADWFYQAQKKAVSYLDYTAFSYTGLIDQLEYEGFTSEQAIYAADNCGADWNVQAARKARDYLNYSAFSRQGLIDQLKYEGFSAEQAEYGATQNGF